MVLDRVIRSDELLDLATDKQSDDFGSRPRLSNNCLIRGYIP